MYVPLSKYVCATYTEAYILRHLHAHVTGCNYAGTGSTESVGLALRSWVSRPKYLVAFYPSSLSSQCRGQKQRTGTQANGWNVFVSFGASLPSTTPAIKEFEERTPRAVNYSQPDDRCDLTSLTMLPYSVQAALGRVISYHYCICPTGVSQPSL